MNLKGPTPRHIIITMAKAKDKENFKSPKRKTVSYKRGLIRLLADFSTETFEAKKGWMKYSK